MVEIVLDMGIRFCGVCSLGQESEDPVVSLLAWRAALDS